MHKLIKKFTLSHIVTIYMDTIVMLALGIDIESWTKINRLYMYYTHIVRDFTRN